MITNDCYIALMNATYRNPWYHPTRRETGPAVYCTDVTPVAYKDYLIYQRIAGHVWDVVKDGVCVTQRAGLEGARQAIDALAHYILVDDLPRPVLNSEGQRIHATDEGIVNFWRWFSDSCAVDTEGRPLVLYHMSKSGEIAVFDPLRKTDLSSFGFHFGTREQAEFRATQGDFAGDAPTLGAFYLAIPTALPVSHMASFAPDHLADVMMGKGLISADWYEDLQAEHHYCDDVAVGAEMVRILRESGVDGLVYENEREGQGQSWVPFAATQIKSATRNPGSFDPTSPAVDDRPLRRQQFNTPAEQEWAP